MRKKVWLPREMLAEMCRYGNPTNVVNKLLEESRGDYIGWDYRPPDKRGDVMITIDIRDDLLFEAFDSAAQYHVRLSFRAILYYVISNGLLPYYLGGPEEREKLPIEVLSNRAISVLKSLIPYLYDDGQQILKDAINILEDIKYARIRQPATRKETVTDEKGGRE